MLTKQSLFAWKTLVVVLSLALIFVAVPHTLEDFALGEPARNGVPAPVLATVIATLFSLQGLALFWVGQNKRRGYLVHAGLGLFWPLAAGLAQLPVLLTSSSYRAGWISIFYVVGLLGLGPLLLLAAIQAWRATPAQEQ